MSFSALLDNLTLPYLFLLCYEHFLKLHIKVALWNWKVDFKVERISFLGLQDVCMLMRTCVKVVLVGKKIDAKIGHK